MPEATPGKPQPTWADIRRFFFPLSGTAIMSTLVQPTMRAGIASASVAWAAAPNSETVAVAVAAYQTAWSMAFLAFGPTLSMTQASIAWSGSPDPIVRERGPWVIMGVGFGLGALMALFAFTPLSEWIFTTLIQSPPQTAHLATEVARWLVPMPVLHAASFMLRGRLIAMHRPQAVRRAQLIDLLSVIIIIQLAVAPFSPFSSLLKGASAAPVAAIAYNLMLCVDIGILLLSLRGQRSTAGK
jgi:Na+-driven multidrug efflux pump